MKLSQGAECAIKRLEEAGFSAFAVGGSVRDFLMGKTPFDFDITTSALPEETKAVFAGEKVIETGIKHGTVTVLLWGEPLEITTFRTDLDYSDCRRPDRVEFTKSLEEDLARRDFTMNAVAYSEKTGFIDPFGGLSDIENRTIRAVGEPAKRFGEDALRIMRALRFAAALGFEIEENTSRAIFEKKDLLLKVSAERLAAEFLKLICGKSAGAVLRKYYEVIGVFIPEILPMAGFLQQNPHHAYDVLEHSVIAMENVPPKPALRLGALFHDLGKPETFFLDENGVGHFYGHPKLGAKKAEEILRRLRLDNETIGKVTLLVEKHDLQIEENEKAVRRTLGKLGPENFFDLILLKRGDCAGRSPALPFPEEYFDFLENTARKILAEYQCLSLKTLAVSGRDLKAAGFAPGPKMGEILKTLLEAVLEEEIPNEKEKLLKFAKKRFG